MAKSPFQVEGNIREISKTICLKDQDSWNMRMALFILGSGRMVRKLEWGKSTGLIRFIKVSGWRTRLKALANVTGLNRTTHKNLCAIDIKVSLKMDWEMDLGCFSTQMGLNRLGIGRITTRGKEPCFNLTCVNWIWWLLRRIRLWTGLNSRFWKISINKWSKSKIYGLTWIL